MGTIFYDPKIKAVRDSLPKIADDIILYLEENKSWKDVLPDLKQIKTYNIVPVSILSLLNYCSPIQVKMILWGTGAIVSLAIMSAMGTGKKTLRSDIEDYLSSSMYTSDWEREGFSREEIENFSYELTNILKSKLNEL